MLAFTQTPYEEAYLARTPLEQAVMRVANTRYASNLGCQYQGVDVALGNVAAFTFIFKDKTSLTTAAKSKGEGKEGHSEKQALIFGFNAAKICEKEMFKDLVSPMKISTINNNDEYI